jgi:hypothetical protein
MLGIVVGLVHGLVVGLVVGLWFGLWFGLAFGLVFGLLVGPVVGPVVINTGWSTFILASLWLGVRRRLPFSLMAFLDDAYRLGLLRIVGPVYQFRHASLQDHLAPLGETTPAVAAPSPPPQEMQAWRHRRLRQSMDDPGSFSTSSAPPP